MNPTILAIFLAGTVQLNADLPPEIAAVCQAEGGCVLLSVGSSTALMETAKRKTLEESCRKDSI